MMDNLQTLSFDTYLNKIRNSLVFRDNNPQEFYKKSKVINMKSNLRTLSSFKDKVLK